MPVSVTVLNQPVALAPASSEIWFRTDSTSSGLTDFKYVYLPLFKKEPFGTTPFSSIGTYRVPPRPDTNNGLFSAHRLLKSQFTYTVNPYISRFNPVTNSLVAYQIRYGAQYDPNLVFTDTISVSGSLGLTFSTVHDLSVGDIITVNKDNKNFNPQYDGTCSVTQIVNAWAIRTDKTFSSTLLANESGEIDLVFKYSGTSSVAYAWPGTRQYQEPQSFLNFFMWPATEGRFLTNQPQYVNVQPDDYQTISFILASNNLTNWRMGIDRFDANGNMIGGTTSHIGLSGSNTYMRQDFGIGPMNLINAGLTMSGVSYYRCFMNIPPDMPGQPYTRGSEYRYFRIDNSCSSYNKTRICFLNRRGGYDYFNFTLDNKKTLAIKRTEYQKDLAWNYQVGDRGQTVLAQTADEKFTANSNWITETESEWLQELLTSPDVYVLGNTSAVGAASGGYKLPIIITDNSYEVKTAMRNQVFNLVLNYRMAYDLNLQNE